MFRGREVNISERRDMSRLYDWNNIARVCGNCEGDHEHGVVRRSAQPAHQGKSARHTCGKRRPANIGECHFRWRILYCHLRLRYGWLDNIGGESKTSAIWGNRGLMRANNRRTGPPKCESLYDWRFCRS